MEATTKSILIPSLGHRTHYIIWVTKCKIKRGAYGSKVKNFRMATTELKLSVGLSELI